MSNKVKNILIGILIFLLIIALIIVYFLVNNKNDKPTTEEITATVIASDSKYILVESANKDYLISNIKGTYKVGDTVKLTFKSNEINNEEEPFTIKIIDEELIGRVDKNNATDTSDTIVEQEKDNDISNSSNSNSSNNREPVTNSSNTTNETSSSSNTNKETNSTNSNIKNSSNNETNEIEKPGSSTQNNNSTPDKVVLEYFDNLEADFNSGTIKDTLKSGFITVVDFLFYNGKIKGYTFNNLTESAKLKVLAMTLYFDSKIEKYFPGYKETISNTTSKIYTNLKAKIISTYFNLTSSICEKDSEFCESAKAGFQSLKTSFGLSWSLIKDIAGDGISSIKNAYEIWSGK